MPYNFKSCAIMSFNMFRSFAFYPNRCSSNRIYKPVKYVICYFPLLFLHSTCPMCVEISKTSFFIMYYRSSNSLFLMICEFSFCFHFLVVIARNIIPCYPQLPSVDPYIFVSSGDFFIFAV